MPDITYMRVTGRWTRIIDDRPGDVDDKPDEVGLTGVVTFTPQLGGLPSLPAGSPSRSVTIDEVKALVVDGVLEDLQSRPGVWLAAQVGGQSLFWTASTALRWSGTRLPTQRVTFGPPPAGQSEVHLNDKLVDDTVEYPAPVVGQAQAAAARAAESALAAAQSAADAEAAGQSPDWSGITGKPAAIAAGTDAAAARTAIGAMSASDIRLATTTQMAAPATHGGVTVTVSASPPSWPIADYVGATQQGTRFSVVGPPLVHQPQAGDAHWAAWNGSSVGANVVSHEHNFLLQGPKACLMAYSYGDMDFHILIDGKTARPRAFTLPAGEGYRFIELDFTDDTSPLAVREIRIFLGQIGVVQWLLPAGGDMRPTRLRRFRIGIAASDSFTHGAGGTTEGSISAGSTAQMMAIMSGGTVEVVNAGSQGGSGYLNAATGTTTTPGPNGQTRYGAANRVTAAQAWASTCDLLIVQGGANDGDKTTYPVASVVAAAQQTWQSFAALGKPLVVIGIEGGVFPAIAADLDALNAAVKAAALASPHVTGFIDQRALALTFGTGNVAAKTGDGNADLMVCSDAVHPSRAGFQLIAAQWLLLLAKVMAPA